MEYVEVVVTIDGEWRKVMFHTSQYAELYNLHYNEYIEYINSKERIDVCSVDTITPIKDLKKEDGICEERSELHKAFDDNISIGLVMKSFGHPEDEEERDRVSLVLYLPEGSDVVRMLTFDFDVLDYWDERSYVTDFALFSFIRNSYHLNCDEFYLTMKEVVEMMNV